MDVRALAPQERCGESVDAAALMASASKSAQRCSRGVPLKYWRIPLIAALFFVGGCGGTSENEPTPSGTSDSIDYGGDGGSEATDGSEETGATGGSEEAEATGGSEETEATGGYTDGGGGTDSEASQYMVQGTVHDASGNPIEGVRVTFYIVPRSYGSFYETTTDSNGSYSYTLPEGVYQTFAFYGEPDEGELTPSGTDSGSSFSIPPGHVIDFLWEAY